jgi:PAS domain S-box-containing protein
MEPVATPSAQLVIDQMPVHIVVFDTEMRYLAVSRRFLSDMAFLFSTRIFTPDELIGRSHYATFPNMPPRWRDIHARVLKGEEVSQEEDFLPRADGRADWARWSMKPWRTAAGRIGGALLYSEVITEQVEARRALAESEARFRATFDNAAVGVAHLGPDLRWLRANRALCRILRWPLDQLIVKSLHDISHPEDLAGDLAQIEQIRAGRIDDYSMDKRYLCKDGTIVWGRLTVSCVRKNGWTGDGTGHGSVDYFVIVVEDISARKQAEEQIRMLMRESNHRAKNMLGLVQAIARQIAGREFGDFLTRFNERIQALAANQDLLIMNHWHGADLEDLVRAQIAHFADLVGTRIAVDGPRLHLNAAAAQTIGLAVHELATNAGKYGALSTEAGRVDIRWEMTAGDVFIMDWTESDGPPVRPPHHCGFGSTVINSMATQSLDGEVWFDYRPSGLAWRLTCPGAKCR